MSYYLSLNDQVTGPYTVAQMRSMWRNGTITTETPVRGPSQQEWAPADKMRAVFEPPLGISQIAALLGCFVGVVIGGMGMAFGLIGFLGRLAGNAPQGEAPALLIMGGCALLVGSLVGVVVVRRSGAK